MSVKTPTELFDRFTDILYDYCSDLTIEPHTNYSGRHMFGKACVGFVTDKPLMVAMAIGAVLNNLDRDYAETEEDNPYPTSSDLVVATDSLGFDTILYFPYWQVSE